MTQPTLQLASIVGTSASQDQPQEIRISFDSLARAKPYPYLFDGPRKDYVETGIPLHEASIIGDWETAKEILKKRPYLVSCSINENEETTLHVASSAKSSKQVEEFVEHLLEQTYMSNKVLELKNKNSNTALCLAAEAGNNKIVKMMVKKHRGLMGIAGSQEMKPLHVAALFGNHEVVKYLYKERHKFSDDGRTPYTPGWLLIKCVETDMFDIALEILKEDPELDIMGDVLGLLAGKADVFAETKSNIFMRAFSSVFTVICRKMGAERENEARQLLRIIWGNIAGKPVDEIEVKLTTSESQIPFVAAEAGNTFFLAELMRLHPSLISKTNDNNQSIFHVAVENRHEGIYNMLYKAGSEKGHISLLKDKNDNNILHLAGKCAKKKRLEDVSGVAFQLQQELLWFKDVAEKFPHCRDERNKNGLTPHELFTKEHKELFKEAEEWIKQTAGQCMVVAALIVPVTVGASHTVPGGYNQNDGIPIFSRKVAYMVFLVSDAISFFSALASVIIFLSILASRYAKRDFGESLPNKLMLGLTTLPLAIATTVVSFTSSIFVPYHKDLIWMPVLVSLLATMPVLFATLLYPLFKDVIISTCGSRYLFRPKKDERRTRFPCTRFPCAARFFSRGTLKRLNLL